MSEQIIIDGVDVTKCKFYEYVTEKDNKMKFLKSGNCHIGFCGYLYNYDDLINIIEKSCLDNPDCYYKQLQRLKEDLIALQQTYEACEKEYKALQIKHELFKKK